MDRKRSEEDDFDAIVVGSGYGGSVAACRLSMAGFNVCLLEKGRRWTSQDFPTHTLKILSTSRFHYPNSGITFGPKHALFQVYQQNECLAAVGCGLGGGSLINAGVMLPTPNRARKNSKWPKEWESDWEACEASAATMLRAQSIPVKFPSERVMDEIAEGDIGESLHSSMKLTVNFDLEELASNSTRTCLACGNCLSGCPYDAKYSTDKTYLHSAIQAGCSVRTECEVEYVVENTSEISQESRSCGRGRRWRVYLNQIDYLTSDFVILSAGVFGTSEILFRSKMRGLRVSEKLGSGFSCNGNAVAYVGGTTAPLSGYALNTQQLSTLPFQQRPGPSISSAYTSSLGFTVQSAVLPRAYPHLLFQGITTYGWPIGYGILNGIINKLKYIIGLKSTQSIVLNAIGYDKANGKITFDKDTEKISFNPPHDPLLPRKIEAYQKLSKKLGGILFMSRYRSTSVHLLGGCNSSSDSSTGVCNHNGQVFDLKTPQSVHKGLYVCDASLIPCSVGLNPCLTIAAVAEHASKNLVQDVLDYKTITRSSNSENLNDKDDKNSTVMIGEIIKGHLGGMPCAAYLKFRMNSKIPKRTYQRNSIIQVSTPILRGKVSGYMVFRALEKDKLQIIEGEVEMCGTDWRTPYTQYMHYHIIFVASSGSKYVLEGKKIMNPYLCGLYAWTETRTLYVTFRKLGEGEAMVNLRGELRVSFILTVIELLKTLMKPEGLKAAMFTSILLGSFARTYFLQIPRGCADEYFIQNDSSHKSYPDSNLHKLKTEDGYVLDCRQWKCGEGEKTSSPVLLLNGLISESYMLPTEAHDLVRTLLEKGQEVWQLQSRFNSANRFTIDDIGKYDIPAAINKILELHGLRTKIHVIAHCVGGLAIHIAIMGGHVDASNLASLSCINSSMFFKLTTLHKIKMWLPLLPITKAILGKNNSLPKTSFRHRLLKGITYMTPKYERCTSKECEVYSGIFGNTFWHENISPTMHHWLNKQMSTSNLPIGGFDHFKKICNSGFIVDTNGNNSYLIHPERMAVSTLYISGGRSLIVSPETSFLANKYMMLHQPGFRHERVVAEEFGHSDLLVGEKSYEEVFPKVLSHIKRAELEGNGGVNKYSKEVLDWCDDPYQEYARFGSWMFLLAAVFLVLLFLLLF